MNKVVFLDIDGTIIYESGPIVNSEDIILLPDSIKALQLLQLEDYELILITNQGRLVSNGLINEDRLKDIHNSLVKQLDKFNIEIKDILYCAHEEDNECICKPSPFLLFEAAKKYKIELSEAWLIGNKATDIEAGVKANCQTYLIATNGFNGANLLDAAYFILGSVG